jgi:hypothetical protein
MAPRQVLQGAVREAADEMVEAADDGQLPWAWREPAGDRSYESQSRIE